MTRLRVFLATITLLAFGCGGQRFPVDAIGTLRSAARQSASGRVATLRGSMVLDGSELVLLTGTVDMRNRRASISTADARRPARYPPFESRFVDRWTYIGIDSAVRRPSGLSPSANWVAFQDADTARELPIPERTMPPGFVIRFIDQLRTHAIADAHFVDRKNGSSKVQFQLPNFGSRASEKPTYTVTVDSDGRVGEIAIVNHATQGGRSDAQDENLTLAWTQNTRPIEAPPSSEVQRLAPGEDLYATDRRVTTTTQPATTTSPLTLGPISESDAIAGNQGLFDADRVALEATLRAQADPKLADFSFSRPTNTVRVALVYQHPARENRALYDAFAWHVAQILSDTFWSRELVQAVYGQHADPAWLPKLRIQLDNVSYLCPAAVEIEVAVHGISQPDWLRRCAAGP